MNHDDTHCSNYTNECPLTCYRAQLTKELLGYSRYSQPVSWKKFAGTLECPLWQRPQSRYYRKHREEIISRQLDYYYRNKAERQAYSREYYAQHKDLIKRKAFVTNKQTFEVADGKV